MINLVFLLITDNIKGMSVAELTTRCSVLFLIEWRWFFYFTK